MIQAIASSELKRINKATEQIYVAAQFLSACGEYLGKKKEDGSHANMGWLSMKEKFITHPLGNKDHFVVELSPEDMELTIANIRDKVWTSFKLKGETKDSTLNWIRAELLKYNIEGAKNYKLSFPYDLPEYADFTGKKFKQSPKKAFIAFSKLRTWGEYFVSKHKTGFELAGETRTWPHHFDHSSYIPLEKSKNGDIKKSITIGLAIHDDMLDEAYFFISALKSGKELDLSQMKPMSSGYWLNESFKGAVLPINDLADDLNFEQRIDSFFTDAKEQLLELLKYKD